MDHATLAILGLNCDLFIVSNRFRYCIPRLLTGIPPVILSVKEAALRLRQYSHTADDLLLSIDAKFLGLPAAIEGCWVGATPAEAGGTLLGADGVDGHEHV